MRFHGTLFVFKFNLSQYAQLNFIFPLNFTTVNGKAYVVFWKFNEYAN